MYPFGHQKITIKLIKCNYEFDINILLVFPPAPKKGMVKGHFKRVTICLEGTFECAATGYEGIFNVRRHAKRALLSPSWKLNMILPNKKFMSLSMMQLLSVLFKCKLHFLFIFRLIIVFSY